MTKSRFTGKENVKSFFRRIYCKLKCKLQISNFKNFTGEKNVKSFSSRIYCVATSWWRSKSIWCHCRQITMNTSQAEKRCHKNWAFVDLQLYPRRLNYFFRFFTVSLNCGLTGAVDCRVSDVSPPQTTSLPPDRSEALWSTLGWGKSGIWQVWKEGNNSTLEIGVEFLS